MVTWGGSRSDGSVLRYLSTKLGLSTPPIVAARLLALAPETIGLSGSPNAAEIHCARTTLEHIAQGRGEVPADENTGLHHRMPSLAAARPESARKAAPGR